MSKWQWPRCQCGGIAVDNSSGNITRTCIRCGAIVRPAYPPSEQMAEELLASGWTQEHIGRWKAPNGALYLGPFQAWKAMNGLLLREGVFGDSRS